MTESHLIERLKNGDNEGFRQLIENFKNKVFNTCYGFIQNKEEADDLAQEVFIEVFKSINKFNEESTLSTWIYRISVNKSLDQIRKNKRRNIWNMSSDNDNAEDKLYSISDTTGNTPHDILINKERIDILNNAINKLPKNQKTAYILHKYEQLSYKEIADIMATSLSGVESLMHRAKANLKKILYNYYKKS